MITGWSSSFGQLVQELTQGVRKTCAAELKIVYAFLVAPFGAIVSLLAAALAKAEANVG